MLGKEGSKEVERERGNDSYLLIGLLYDMNHPYGSSMFMDLDKPVIKDPRERIEAAMEWEAISEMYARRDEHRKRTGFLKDLHEEKGFTLNPSTGRYRDLPGFNPPRRVSKPLLSDLDVELKAMIVENIRDPRQRQATRGIDIMYRNITTSVKDAVDELISGYGVELVPYDRSLYDALDYIPMIRKETQDSSKIVDIVEHVYREMMRGIPIKVIRTYDRHMSLDYDDKQTHREALQIMQHNGKLAMYYNNFEPHYPEFWKHYPFMREIFVNVASRLVPAIECHRIDRADEFYKNYKVNT